MNPLDHPPIAGEFKDAVEHNAIKAKALGSPTPFSLRLTAQEKATLKREAGTMPLGAYIRTKLLGDGTSLRRKSRMPVKDDKALAQLLGELGRARLANNLNQLAKGVHTGSLPITPETEKAIQTACKDVQWMKDRLIHALGLGMG